MYKRIIIGLYFSFCASVTTVLVMLYLDIPDTKSTVLNTIGNSATLSLLIGCLAFPNGFIFSEKYLNKKYDLTKSLLIGILISFLSLVNFYIYSGIYNALSMPILEAVLSSIGLLFITSLLFGMIIFPSGAISGVILYMLLNLSHNNANK